MRLYIAEKPSLGRAIAEALPHPRRSNDGFILCGDGSCVSWCVGHLLELAEPHDYQKQYKQWNEKHLPIVPEKWQLKVKPKTSKQLKVIKELSKKATEIVHAGDPDREGQLLVDQVIHYLKLDNLPIFRCLINDLNTSAVKKALAQLVPNKTFKNLSISALARTRADWLYGINMTRAYTLQGRKVQYQGVLSVGRVQTPVLGLVVRRDEEIESFISKPYYEVLAHLYRNALEAEDSHNLLFKAKWVPSEACSPYCDDEKRVISKPLAENVVRRISGQPAHIKNLEYKDRALSPPLPYNLSALQIDAAILFHFKAQKVLDLCQQLYETYKLITYPRSDNRYLPEDHYIQRKSVTQAISRNLPSFKEPINDACLDLKNKAWNDKKVEAHHGIIPTQKVLSGSLNEDLSKVYQLICRQYLYQFYEPYRYKDTTVSLEIAGGKFIAKGLMVKSLGWKSIGKLDRVSGALSAQEIDDKPLPQLKKDDELFSSQAELQEKHTQPPKHFTDATLLSAMTGISRFVKSPEIRKVLRETDGLGTEATRAGILELLFKRNFLQRSGKVIQATETGKALVMCLPEIATVPDMTAQWESSLSSISQGESGYKGFMDPLVCTLEQMIKDSIHVRPSGLKNHKLMSKRKPYKKRKKTRGAKGSSSEKKSLENLR